MQVHQRTGDLLDQDWDVEMNPTASFNDIIARELETAGVTPRPLSSKIP